MRNSLPILLTTVLIITVSMFVFGLFMQLGTVKVDNNPLTNFFIQSRIANDQTDFSPLLCGKNVEIEHVIFVKGNIKSISFPYSEVVFESTIICD
jgi:hypothetical protein